MKELIKNILNDVSKTQVNLESEAVREMIVNLIMAGIKSNKGWYLDLGTRDNDTHDDDTHDDDSTNDDNVCLHNNNLNSTCSECDEQQAKDLWVCKICNKSTYDVEYDYVGSGTNHLGCELEIEMKDDNLDTAGYPVEKINDYLVRHIDKAVMIDSTNDDSTNDSKPKIKPQEKQYTVVEDLGWDARDKKQTIIGKISESEYEWLITSK